MVTRPSRAHYTASREELLWRTGELFDWAAAGKITVRIGGRYPLDQARQAQDDLENRRSTGKLLLDL
jgi:NADPH2:quinone reductase